MQDLRQRGVRPLYTPEGRQYWTDAYFAVVLERYGDRVKYIELYACLSRLFPGLMPCLIETARREIRPGEDAAVIPLPTYAIELLTGSRVLDENLAGMTGLWSLRDTVWHPGYLERLGLREEQLPSVIPLRKPAARTRARNVLGIPAGLPVFSCGNDQSAAAVAAGLDPEGGALITLGSAQVVYQRCRALPPADDRAMRGCFPGGGFFRLLADGAGGHVISRILDQLKLDGFGHFFALAGEGFAAGAPLPRMDAGGAAVGWEPADSPPALQCAAALELLVDGLAADLRYLDIDPRREPVLLADGGGARNAVWRERIRRRLGVDLELRPATPDRGAAQMTLVA
jgi:sugar (pentulose or hexulose) kinase